MRDHLLKYAMQTSFLEDLLGIGVKKAKDRYDLLEDITKVTTGKLYDGDRKRLYDRIKDMEVRRGAARVTATKVGVPVAATAGLYAYGKNAIKRENRQLRNAALGLAGLAGGGAALYKYRKDRKK